MEAHQVRDVTLGVGLTIVGVLEGTLGLTGGHEPWYLVATVPLVTAAAAASNGFRAERRSAMPQPVLQIRLHHRPGARDDAVLRGVTNDAVRVHRISA